MAIVVPYGDAQAHGSLACSLSFRRSRGKVVLQKKPKPRQPNTSAQQAHKQKFKDGWKAYHQLDAWALDYLTKKAVELGTTKANLYLSQYLKDEIPSDNPLSLIKDIIDISIPKPEATEDDGMKIDILSHIDAGPVITSYGHTYDKENSFTDGAVAIAHQRELIKLTRSYVPDLNIPFDYPIVVTWKAFNDAEHVSLIRFPEFVISDTKGTSDTPMTDIKEITAVNLIDKFTGASKTINVQFLTYKTSNQQYQGMGNIWDNENIFRPGVIADVYDKIFFQLDDIETPPSTIPADYEIEISYKNFADDLKHVHVKLPTFQLTAGTAPSTNPLNNIKKVTDMDIGRLIGDAPASMGHYVAVHPGTHPPELEMGYIFDNANVFVWIVDSPASRAVLMQWRGTGPYGALMENYYIDITYDDFVDDPHTIRLWYPYTPSAMPSWTRFFIADDMSVYSDYQLTNLLKPGDPNRKRLWIADDWSLYWDDAFTQLATPYSIPPVELWLADDFSLYWDKELTQLANTPFF